MAVIIRFCTAQGRVDTILTITTVEVVIYVD